MTRLLAGVMGALLAVGLATGAAAQGAEEASTLRIDVPVPDSISGDLARHTREELAKQVSRQVRKRLESAAIKFQTVRAVDGTTVVVEANSEVDRSVLVGVAMPPGEFALRPIRRVGTRWQDLMNELPAGVELRQGEGALDRDNAHLWAPTRGKLEDFISKISLGAGEVLVFSTGDGWRSVTLGEPILTHANVEESEIRTVRTGAPYVTLQIDADGSRALGGHKRTEEVRYAAVLDGEVVAVVEGSALSSDALNLSAPEYLSGEEALQGWSRQVAGRLAARIPLELLSTKE